jgi:serine phosphatase RsbU (regulator of sigma subunit)
MQGERMAAELEAARTAQRVLVPEQLTPIEGYRIESAYEPAQELSGDFYQVLPAGGGATLLALGDVSGKGLTAAMTGTLAIGVMRQLAVEGLRPAELLAALNNRLVAAGPGGFITLVCVLVGAKGEATLAKAGHLNPYLDGDEFDLGASLPLGLAAGVDYTELRLTLQLGSKLTLLSDGVVEARSPSGELLGFDRTRGLSARPAKEIAAAARDFGQDDDITVLTIERTVAATA